MTLFVIAFCVGVAWTVLVEVIVLVVLASVVGTHDYADERDR
jgi:hypothetical protein